MMIMARPCLIKYIFIIICLYVTISQQRNIKEAELDPFELDDFLNQSYVSKKWNGSWITDSAILYLNEDGDMYKFDFATKKSDLFLTNSIWENYTEAVTSISGDLAYVLISYNESAVFRHSTTAQFTIYDIKNAKYYNIANSEPLQLVKFAPEGHGLVYVKDNNIYYLDDFAVDVQNPVTVTTAGKLGFVYCGVPDWVYEEEVLSSGSALWFSPDANHIAYAVFHDENVTNFSYTLYGRPGSLEDQYPHEAVIRYPKVGTPNPLVSVYLYNFQSGSTVEFQLPPIISNKRPNDYILYDLTWISSSEVAMISTNRVQNETAVVRCFIDGQCTEETLYKQNKGWIDAKIPIYNEDGTKRLQILPQPEGDDEFDHLVLTDLKTNTATRLTYGQRTILSINEWNHNTGLIYYGATVNDTPSNQHVYVTDERGGSNACLTCEIIVDGEACTSGELLFSKNFSYYVKACAGPKPPLYHIVKTSNESDIYVWEDNSDLRQKLAAKSFPVIKKLLVPINDQFDARVKILLPPNLNESSNKKYPAIVYTYGGPNSNQISETFGVGLPNYIVTKREYIWILIDGRGSGRDGYNKLFTMYRKFATVEIDDQIQVTKYLQDNLPYIDADRTGIWGWSYGGFCSSWALAKDVDNVFLFALSVAPVTNFIYYDTIYTERYMGLNSANDNEVGYNSTDLSRVVEAFRGRNYFVIHGNGDDNVHYQNTMLLIKALEEADIDFRQHSYPDENHSLGGVSRHLYHMIDKYWAEQFRIDDSLAKSWKSKEQNRRKQRKHHKH